MPENRNIMIAAIAALSISVASAEGPRPQKSGGAAPANNEFHWCHSVHRPIDFSKANEPSDRLAGLSENEPNDSAGTAQILPLGSQTGQDVDVDVTGTISSGTDVDFFRVSAKKGDILGVACISNPTTPSMDPVLSVLDGAGTLFFLNDDGVSVQSIYPSASPWPKIGNNFDSALTFIAPSDGNYLLKVAPYGPSTTGNYTLKIRLREAFLHSFESPAHQRIFIDFDGATIDISPIFLQPGAPSIVRSLSPLSSFLAGWGLSLSDQDAVIDAVMTTINENFDSLRQASLNDNLDAAGPIGSFDVEFLNSKDDPDPFGEKNVSRIIVGGTINELLINTIGIAESVDPGNFNTEETGVVLLDLLSGPATGDSTCCSLNDIPRAPGVSKIQLIGVALGNIISHEIGHYLGSFHTTNENATPNLMDEGGQLQSFVGAGPNGIFGDTDDTDVDFITDSFSNFEDVGFGTENTSVIEAFGLSTGKLPASPPQVIDSVPPRDTNLGKLQQVTVTFSESVVGISANQMRVNGSTALSVSGNGAGPYLFAGFVTPIDGDVTCELAANNITDVVGNKFAGDVLHWTIKDCNGNGVLDDDDISSGNSLDCNGNGTADECDQSILRSRSIEPISIAAGQTLALGDVAPFVGGDPPYTFKWTLRGNPAGEESTDLNATFGPMPPGTYAPRLVVTDANGCEVASYLTIEVTGDASSGGNSGGQTNEPTGNFGGGSGSTLTGSDCGQGSACGVTGGGLVTMICGYAGLLGRRRRQKQG